MGVVFFFLVFKEQFGSAVIIAPFFSLYPICVMTSSYAHVMDRQASISSRLESPITANLENLQAKKNFSVSHLLDLEEAGEMVGTQTEDGVGEAGRSMLESPGLTSGSDTTQQESKCKVYATSRVCSLGSTAHSLGTES